MSHKDKGKPPLAFFTSQRLSSLYESNFEILKINRPTSFLFPVFDSINFVVIHAKHTHNNLSNPALPYTYNLITDEVFLPVVREILLESAVKLGG